MCSEEYEYADGTRRGLLAAFGAGATTALAGCSTSDDAFAVSHLGESEYITSARVRTIVGGLIRPEQIRVVFDFQWPDEAPVPSKIAAAGREQPLTPGEEKIYFEFPLEAAEYDVYLLNPDGVVETTEISLQRRGQK